MSVDLSLRWQVIEGDCLKVVPPYQRVIADALISDPPYGIGYGHGGGGKGQHSRRNVGRVDGETLHWDKEPFDPAPWLDQPIVLLWGANHFARRLPEAGTWIAWDKHCGLGPDDSFADAEFAWTNARTKRNVARVLWKGIVSVKEGETRTRLHPTQKPLALMRWCIETLDLPPDALIMDPYCGSGSTGVAAVQLGHRFIGIEREPQYVAIARQRIADAAAQGNLFQESA